jgi:MFS family permease
MTAPPPHRSLPLRQLRRMTIAVTVVGAVLFAVPMALYDFGPAAWVWLAVPVVVGVAMTALIRGVGSSMRPLAPLTNEERARALSPSVLQSVTFTGIGMAGTPGMFGVISAASAQSAWPIVLGLAFFVPLMALLVYPRDAVVEALRHRLEADGAKSWLWESLARPTRDA